MDRWIDLHMHSTASDGTVDPENLPAQAERSYRKHESECGKKELSYREHVEDVEFFLALTDHDTVSGVKRLLNAAKDKKNFHIIPGVEISCDYHGKEIHMLGLGVDPDDEVLNKRLAFYRDERDLRNVRILAKFEEIGIHIPEDALEVQEGESVGRPHFARFLVDQGYVGSIKEAFDRYLGEEGICFVERRKPEPEEAIGIILGAGGIPVLAHPMQYKFFTREEMDSFVAMLKDQGLLAIEAYYSEFSDEEVAYVEDLAERYGLLKSGGSDFHGENKPEIEPGYGWGNLGKTMDRLEEILEKLV